MRKNRMQGNLYITREATIDGPYRYTLARKWDFSLPALVVIGLNPSTADANVDDATIRVLVGYANRLRFGSLTMLNLYAWRATQPVDMLTASSNGSDVVGPQNTFADLRARIDLLYRPTVYAAWGSIGRERGDEFIAFCKGREFKCFAVNKDGSPHHPLHVSLTGPVLDYKGSRA